jgi:hypothetical protein
VGNRRQQKENEKREQERKQRETEYRKQQYLKLKKEFEDRNTVFEFKITE